MLDSFIAALTGALMCGVIVSAYYVTEAHNKEVQQAKLFERETGHFERGNLKVEEFLLSADKKTITDVQVTGLSSFGPVVIRCMSPLEYRPSMDNDGDTNWLLYKYCIEGMRP